MKITGKISGFRSASWLGLGFLLALTSAHAQITVVSSNATSNQFLAAATYNQDFNTLRTSGEANWANNSTLRAWYASYRGTSSGINLLTSGPNIGDLLSAGTGTERALGACPGSNTPMYLAFRIVNGTAETLTGLTLQYDLEKYGTGNNSTILAYQVFNAGGGSVTGGTWISITTVTQPGTGLTSTLANLSVGAGKEIWFRWQVSRTGGSATATAVDNLTISSLIWASASVAPSIQQQPASLITEDGGAATFSVQASGNPPPSFQWRRNGSALAGGTNSSLVIDPASPADAGSYDVVVSNAAGSVTSTTATLSIRADSPSFVPAGGLFTNSVLVTILAPTAGTTVRYTSDGSVPSSTQGTVYTAPFALTADASLKAVAIGPGLTDSTVAVANFTVVSAPAVVTQPLAQTVLESGSASFSVSATGSPTPSYQWRLDGVDIPGATSGLLLVSPATAASAGVYDVVISNSVGAIVSQPALLSVQARAPTLSPAPGTYTNSVTVTLTSVTSGTSIRYTLDGSAPSAIQGEPYTGPLNLAATTTVRAVATGGGLMDSTEISGAYTVTEPPPFSGGIHLTAVAEPTNARVVALSNSYVQNFSALAGSGSGLPWNDDLSATPTLPGWSVNRTTYGYIANNTTTTGLYSSGTSSDRWVGGVLSASGGPVHLGLRLVNRSGSTVQAFQLSFDARRVTNAGSNSIVVLRKKFPVGEGSLTNLPATNGNATTILSDLNGWTEVWRTNGLAADTNNLTVSLSSLGLASGEEMWLGWMLVKAGGGNTLIGLDNVRLEGFSAGASPTPSAPVASPAGGTYTGAQTISLSTITAGTTIRYTLDGSTPAVGTGTIYSGPISMANSATLKAIAYLGDGTASAVATQNYVIQSIVPTAPVFNSLPVSQAVTEGGSVTLAASASGHPTPTYQWSRNGTPIAGQTNPSLGLAALQGNQAGTYQVTASNSEGTASASATVTVRAATPVVSPNGGSYASALTVSLSCASSNTSIRYTLNGSEPTVDTGTLYAGPLPVTNSATLKAVAYRSDLTASPVASASFVIAGNTANPADFLSPRFTGVTTNSNILFHTTNNYLGSSVNLYLDVYRPAGDTATNRPVVMLVHGGGFRNGSGTTGTKIQRYIVAFANEFARRGFVAVSIDYRTRSGTHMPTTADELPALKDAAADGMTALQWIRRATNAAAYGYDPNAIFLAGGSAGGRTTTALACRETGDTGGLPTTDPYSPTGSSITSDANAVYDRTGCIAAAILWGGPEPEYRCYTVDASDLPCVIVHGTYDVTLQTESSPTLYQALIDVGVPAQLNLANGYDHSLGTTSAASAEAKPQTAVWMAEFFIQQWQRKLAGGVAADPVPGMTKRPGESATLQAPYTASYPPTVKWRKDGVVLAGKTNPTLFLSSVQAADGGQYDVVLSTPLGSWSSASIAALEVENAEIASVNYDTGANSYSHPVEVVVSAASLSVASAGTTFYVDSAAGDDTRSGTSEAEAWKSLDRVNATTFLPGDRILFKAGGVWTGTLRPLGSGTAASPISVDRYGTGAKPLIDGNGVEESATNSGAAVRLHNQSFWEIRNLEVVNDGPADGLRRGIHVTAENFGVMEGIRIRGCTVRNIRGKLGDSDGDLVSKRTGGIIVETLSDSVTATRFHDVLIESNVITTVRNQGIVAAGNRTGQSDYPNTAAWHARKATQLVIRGNTISDVSKNAVILRLADATGLVERNVCFNTATLDTGNTMFTAACDGSVFQYNEGYSNNAVLKDGSLYDADLRSTGIIFQYSYSHDNGHGLFWQYPSAAGPNNNIVVRYNVSRNDRGNIFAFSGDAGGVSSTLIHNNVVYLPAGSTNRIIDARSGTHTYTMANNIFYLLGEGISYDTAGHTATFDANVFFGVHPASEPSDPRKITADPKFVNPLAGGPGLASLTGFQLQADSPCIDAGTTTLGVSPGPQDFFGNALPLSGSLDIGIQQTLLSPPVPTISFSSLFPGQAADSDADTDGVPALVEYALGGATNRADGDRLPAASYQSGTASLVLDYAVRTNDPKLEIWPERIDDLASTNWQSNGITVQVIGNTNVNGQVLEQRRASVPSAGTERRFLRLKIKANP